MSNELKPASKPGDTPHSLHAVVSYLRQSIQHAEEAKNRLETEGAEKSSIMYWSGKSSFATEMLQKFGGKAKPDAALLIEAETLLPKCGFWNAHEMNRTLHHYKNDAKNNNYPAMLTGELLLRRRVIAARIEVGKQIANSPHKPSGD